MDSQIDDQPLDDMASALLTPLNVLLHPLLQRYETLESDNFDFGYTHAPEDPPFDHFEAPSPDYQAPKTPFEEFSEKLNYTRQLVEQGERQLAADMIVNASNEKEAVLIFSTIVQLALDKGDFALCEMALSNTPPSCSPITLISLLKARSNRAESRLLQQKNGVRRLLASDGWSVSVFRDALMNLASIQARSATQ
eukprot:TRINITY_DN12039_c0_g1::TRINITY_DN12039_c0_g1_i1::g.9721::m.9721 TRINITY_DN12039_c0_g1::TRINITY_DN12039_c0_g1_i1::g.9721  ORF type:complete len:195 (-),score=7.67 TRINITY_DN12039_c0_g1_i1:602-1186(-)